jgi:hypothetical protein
VGAEEGPEPEWKLDDPVGDLLGVLQGFQERLESRLAQQKASGRPQSVKRLALALLRDLIHEHKGSCSESDLITWLKRICDPYWRFMGTTLT